MVRQRVLCISRRRLSRILDHDKIAFAREFEDRIHVPPADRRDAPEYRLRCAVTAASSAGRRSIDRCAVHIDKHRPRS